MCSPNAVFGAFFSHDSSEAISMGGDFGLGGTVSGSVWFPLADDPVVDLDYPPQLATNLEPVADLR